MNKTFAVFRNHIFETSIHIFQREYTQDNKTHTEEYKKVEHIDETLKKCRKSKIYK